MWTCLITDKETSVLFSGEELDGGCRGDALTPCLPTSAPYRLSVRFSQKQSHAPIPACYHSTSRWSRPQAEWKTKSLRHQGLGS